MSKILITGATGPLGAAVTQNLLKSRAAADLRVLVRDAAKAAAWLSRGVATAIGDYDHYPSLLAALQGIDKLFLVSGNDIVNRARQQSNVLQAAQAAGVKQVVYTSLQRKDDSPTSPVADKTAAHLDTEKQLKESGMTYTVLQYALYADIIPVFAGQQLLETKTIYLPAGEGKVAYAVRTELAEAGAKVLLDDSGKYANKIMQITGPAAVSWPEIAEIISAVTGQQISYVSPAVDEFTATLNKAGVPAELIDAIAGMQKAVAEGEYAQVTTELEELLGRKPETVAAYLQTVYAP